MSCMSLETLHWSRVCSIVTHRNRLHACEDRLHAHVLDLVVYIALSLFIEVSCKAEKPVWSTAPARGSY